MVTYALVGERSGDLLTYGGRVLLHENRAEMAYLFPNNRVVEYKANNDLVMRLRDHPDLHAITFPLNKADFR